MKPILFLGLFFFSSLVAWGSQKSEKDTLRFAVLSDIHFALTGKDQGLKMLGSGRKIFSEVLRELNKRGDLDFVIFTGDLLDHPKLEELQVFKNLVKKRLKKPFYVIPGNHDRKMKDSTLDAIKLSDFVRAFENHPYSKSSPAYWSFDRDIYHLIGLDSTRDDSWGGRIDAEQVAWLKKDLEKNREKFTIIFTHHSLLEFYPKKDLRKEFFVENFKEIERILKKNRQIQLVVSGHYHFPAAIYKNGVHHMTLPSIVTYPCAYAVFAVAPKKVEVKMVSIKDKAVIQKAKEELPKAQDWRIRFQSDEEMIRLFEGIRSYTFKPRN